MSVFDPITCTILLNTGQTYTRADAANVPTSPGVTMSVSHEYVHFLQAISSLSGFRFLADLIDFGIQGALLLEGVTTGHNDRVTGYHSIIPMLHKQKSGTGRKANSDIDSRAQTMIDEANALFSERDYPYSGTRKAWDLHRQDITVGSYTEPFGGYITPRGTFRPFTPGLLSEGMARRIDQWVKASEGFTGHAWRAGVVEDEHYNGIHNILRQKAYASNVTPHTLDRITVILCSLALASKRPDESMLLMLKRLMNASSAGGMAVTVGLALQGLLVQSRQLHANYYNEVMNGILEGPSRIMDRGEWLPIHEQLKNIHWAANAVIRNPSAFASSIANWAQVRQWMKQYSLPPVVASDGPVGSLDKIVCTTTVTDFLSEVERVLL